MKTQLDKLATALLYGKITPRSINNDLYDRYIGYNEWLSHLSTDDQLILALLILESENFWGE